MYFLNPTKTMNELEIYLCADGSESNYLFRVHHRPKYGVQQHPQGEPETPPAGMMIASTVCRSLCGLCGPLSTTKEIYR
jgi:hypothetical protein